MGVEFKGSGGRRLEARGELREGRGGGVGVEEVGGARAQDLPVVETRRLKVDASV